VRKSRLTAVLFVAFSNLMAHAAQAEVRIRGTLDATPPPPSEHYFAQRTVTASSRLFRDGHPSECRAPKASPGSQGGSGGGFRHDVFTITAEETRCHTIRVLGGLGLHVNVHVSVHSSFSAADPSAKLPCRHRRV
jgi:hypothetical protein